MAETSGPRLRGWLLLAALDLGGAGSRQRIHARIEGRFGSQFTDEDRAKRVGRGNELAWMNNVDSLYDRLKRHEHLFELTVRGDPWRLTAAGMTAALQLRAAPVTEDDLFSDFRPRDSGAYIAHVHARVLIKGRDHEAVLHDYGTGIAASGWRPDNGVHPRDLELRRDGQCCLAEVKMVYNGNGTQAARAAMAQLLEYRYFMYADREPDAMLAIFSEAVGDELVGMLESYGVSSVWRVQSAWKGSAGAHNMGLVP